ncbi:hypothetical protein Vadar_015663 [Vaccinium darrowii]|uniref:Uncharacterized protein n=1 Tax=Vaccinium darrowii TaxID=229202 RepID=A0ACB7YDQ9_9ERIC|nr:hypothetical protein Vadar_015663 [Vaccinium darrowii]
MRAKLEPLIERVINLGTCIVLTGITLFVEMDEIKRNILYRPEITGPLTLQAFDAVDLYSPAKIATTLYGRGDKSDSEMSVDKERLMSKSPLPEENKLKAVKLGTREGMKDLENPAPLETLAMDPEDKSTIPDVFANSKENKDTDKASMKVYTRRFAVRLLLYKIDGLFLGHKNKRIFLFTTNHGDQHGDAASLRPVGKDIYIHTSLPQPIALPDGGKRTYCNHLLVSNSEKANMREAYDSTKGYLLPNFDATDNNAMKIYNRRGRDCSRSMELEQLPTFAELGKDPENTREASKSLCMTESVLSLDDSTTRISSTDFDAPDYRADLVRALVRTYQSDPTMFNSEKKDTREGLNGECLTKSVLSDDDSTKRNSLPDCTSLASFSELTIEDIDDKYDFDDVGMLPNLKDEFVDGLSSSCGDKWITVSTTNHRDPHDAALLPLVNLDTDIHTASHQPIALPNGGEIVQLESSEQKSLVDFDATNDRAYQSGVLASSEKKYTIDAYKGRWESLIQRTEKDIGEGLNEEYLTKCALILDDSTEQNSVDPRRGRGRLHSTEHEQPATFVELGTDPEIEGVVSDLLRNCSLIVIKDIDHWVEMLPNLKSELMLSSLLEIIHGLLSSCGDERIIILTTNHNHMDRVDAALLHPLNIDLYVHTPSPQPIAVPDGGEIVQLDSSERKPLEDFDATNNRAYQSDVLVSNSEKQSTRETSRRQCMPEAESVLGFVDSTTRISSTDFDAPNNSAHLVWAYQSGPIGFNSEKKHLGEGLNRECLTKSVLSLDDSSRQKLLPDVEATKNRGEALKRECIIKSILGLEDLQQHIGGRRDDAAKNFRDSLARKSFKVIEILPIREQRNDCVPSLSIGRLILEGWVQEEKSPNLARVLQINIVEQRVTKLPICLEGLLAESASSSRWPIGLPNGRRIVMLDPLKQSTKNIAHAVWVDQCSPTVSLPEKKMVRKTLKRKCKTMSGIFEIHQQHFGRRCEGSAKSFCAMCIGKKHGTNQKWATRKRYSAGDERSFQVSRLSMNEKLDSRLQFIHISQCAKADESGPTVSNSERGSLGEALQCDSLTNTLGLNDLRKHFGARCKDAAKGLCGCLGLPAGGHIPSLLEKKIVRKTLKRQSRTMSVLSLEDHQQHVGRRWEDDAKFLGAKRICRQVAIDCKPTEKRILKQHGTRRCQFKQSAIDLPDGGHILSLSKKKIVRKTLKRKCRNMSVLRSEYHQHVDSKWDDAVKSLGAKHIYRQLVIHRVSRAKRICRQHGFHRWPFQQNWATLKGYFLGDERPVDVISLSMDGKLVSRLQLIHISWLGKFSPWPPALPPGEIVGRPLALSSSQLPSTSNRAHLGGQDQSGSTTSHSQNERTRDQPEGRKRKIKNLTIEDLRPYVGLTRADAAKKFQMSETTFKRQCRRLKIEQWPKLPPGEEVLKPPDPPERNTGQNAMGNEVGHLPEPIEVSRLPYHERNGSLQDYIDDLLCGQENDSMDFQSVWQEMEPNPNPNPDVFLQTEVASTHMVSGNMGIPNDHRNSLASQAETRLKGHGTGSSLSQRIQDMSFVTLKVYGLDTIKFKFPLESGINELKGEVAKRLNLEPDSFNMKYEDEEGEQILIPLSEDLRDYLSSSITPVIKLWVVSKVANLTNLCESCGGSLKR